MIKIIHEKVAPFMSGQYFFTITGKLLNVYEEYGQLTLVYLDEESYKQVYIVVSQVSNPEKLDFDYSFTKYWKCVKYGNETFDIYEVV